MANLPQYFDRIQYELHTNLFGSSVIDEPQGWESDDKEYSRHEDYFGIFPKFSSALKFIGSAADYIQQVYDIEGVNAELRLVKLQKHPHTDEWELVYTGYLDLSTWEREKNTVSVKFSSGGLELLLKNREGTDVEIDRADTLDSRELPALETIDIELKGREIFLDSKWKTKDDTQMSLGVYSDDGNTRAQVGGIPVDLDVRSHEDAHAILQGSYSDSDTIGSAGMMLYSVADRQRTMHLFSNEFKFTPVVTQGLPLDINWARIYIAISTYTYDSENEEYRLKNRDNLFKAGFPNPSDGELPFYAVLNKENTISFDKYITLEKGDCLALELYIKADLNNFTTSRARFYVELHDLSLNFQMQEESQFPSTQCKGLFLYDALERLSEICTSNKNSFYSEFLGRQEKGYANNGTGAFTSITHGFWVRGFDKLPIPTDEPKVENLFKPLTTSFRDAFKSASAIWGVGLGIEKQGRKERIRVEDKRYFFNPNVTIKLPNQVNNVKRSVATTYYYSKLINGYEQGGEYEEAFGLDEYNGRLEHQTPIIRLSKDYTNLSTYRGDMYGMEFCRRKQRVDGDTIDTSYDESIWILDLKQYSSHLYIQRLWQDDFAKEPTGIFSPNTATNLRFSPANNLMRNSWYFSACFWKDLDKYLKYTSSSANSGMTTQLIGKNPIKENQDFLCADFDHSYFVPEWIEFDHVCDFEIMKQVEGKTVINGKEITNLYGCVQFTNENNEIEKGYLFNLKPNKEGKWKLLKANR